MPAKAQSKTSAKRGNKKTVETKDVLVNFVFDMSGSMSSCWNAAIEGFNEYIRDLKNDEEGETYLSLTVFDTVFENWYVVEPIKNVEYVTNQKYIPRGMTALYDAIANSIAATEKKMKEMGRGDLNVLTVVLTDGLENSSQEYSIQNNGRERIAELIKSYEAKGNWTFVYLGAGHDAVAVASAAGFSPGNAAYYSATPSSIPTASAGLSNVTKTVRSSGGTTSSAFADAGMTQDYRDEDDPNKIWTPPVQPQPDPPKSEDKPVEKKSIDDLFGS